MATISKERVRAAVAAVSTALGGSVVGTVARLAEAPDSTSTLGVGSLGMLAGVLVFVGLLWLPFYFATVIVALHVRGCARPRGRGVAFVVGLLLPFCSYPFSHPLLFFAQYLLLMPLASLVLFKRPSRTLQAAL